MNRRLGAGVLIASLWLTAAAPAWAAAVSSSQLRVLATRAAAGDPVALEDLRAVTTVDGQPTDVAGALAGAGPIQLHARLIALASSTPAPAQAVPSASEARARAAALLANRRYGKPVIDPISSALRSFARWLARLASNTPGGAVVFWALAGAVVLLLAALGARRMLRRLGPDDTRAGDAVEGGGEDPAALEREAQAAETRGAFDEAVRLRFRAGLLQLGVRSAIEYRPSLLTADVARQLHSPDFDDLAGTFDRVAYGGERAREDDARAAREGWPRVLQGAPR